LPWYVLYTRPRNEKKTARLLADKGVVVYCPLQETIKQWSDRKKKVQEPVFKSYLFVKLEQYEAEQVNVLTTQGAVRFLWWQGKPGVVREEEITAIQDFLNAYKGVALQVAFGKGDEVKITEGALKEQKGKIVQIKGNKAYLEITSLGWRVMAAIPMQMLGKH
jgi:transcription antitermination factor NusG